jgi:hypothetical protein
MKRSCQSLAVVLFVSWYLPIAVAEDPTLDEETSVYGKLVLEKKKVRNHEGELVDGIEIYHEPSGASSKVKGAIYNPYFDGTLEPPSAEIWVFAPSGEYLGNLLATPLSKRRSPTPDDFLSILFSRMGRRIPLPIAGPAERLESDANLTLKPGTYRLQAIGYERMRSELAFSSVPATQQTHTNSWLQTYAENNILWRSNVLEIEVPAPDACK